MKAIIEYIEERAHKLATEGSDHMGLAGATRKTAERDRHERIASHSYRASSALTDLANDLRHGVVADEPIPLILFCPACHTRHIDQGEFATKRHHTHACQSCGFVWRPAVVATVGVGYLPGFKDT